jgi:thiol-disulfide isomerase/thioredoxin
MEAPMPLVSGTSIVEDHSLEKALASLRAQHPSRPIVIHIWAEWCGFCRLEEASITSLSADHPVLTIAMQSGSAERVQQHLEDRGLAWPALVDTNGRVAQALGASGVPAFMVIDEDGDLRVPTMGYTTLWGMRLRLWWAMSGFFSSSS